MTDTTTAPRSPLKRIWDRELDHYPSDSTRLLSLGIVVLTTIVLYYQFYLAGALAAGTKGQNGIIPDLNMSFVYYVNVIVIGYLLGAGGSILAGLADRYGRANIVTVGLLLTGLLCLVGMPNVHSKLGFGIVFGLIGAVEGVILVATPALVRDFSPQLGRASAMGFWTLGPVLGSLVVSVVVSSSSDSRPWRDQYAVCGIVGLVVFVIALFGLRELAPPLRDQLMVSSRERALVEARAKGIDVEAGLRRPWPQMLKLDIIGSAFAISFFLIIYYLAVGFFPVYFVTVFNYTQSNANGLGNWFWGFNAGALVLVGVLSDLARVRKPFMVLGAIGAIIATSLFAITATHAGTSHTTFVLLLSFIGISLGVAYAPWMAGFTETIERRNPALTATGLAVWGLIIRLVIALTIFFVPHVVTTATTLVDHGGRVQQLAAGQDPSLSASQNATVKAVAADPTIVAKVQAANTKYAAQVATAKKVDPATLAALTANPTDQASQVKAVSQISGVSVADVTTIATLQATSPAALSAASALDTATAVGLLANPADPVLGAKAVGEVVAKLGVTPAAAQAALLQLAKIPVAQLLVVQASGSAVQSASAELTALATAQAGDPQSFKLLLAYGTSLQDPKVQANLLYLQQQAADVQKAQHDSPRQWQKYFWIAVGGQVLFIPLIFLMAGFWDPRAARRKEAEREQLVDAELAKLTPVG